MEFLLDPGIWIGLLTLIVLEIVNRTGFVGDFFI